MPDSPARSRPRGRVVAARVCLLLPLAIAIAISLVPAPSARWGALAAAILLAAFIAAIARALSRGEQPDCHCFGQIHSEPAGRSTLARNVVLFAFAVVIVVYGSGPALDDWISARSAAELAAVGLGIWAVAAATYAWTLRARNQTLGNDLRVARTAGAAGGRFGLPIGTEAPAFTLEDMRGEPATLTGLLERGKPALLLFMSPGCGPCATMLPKVPEWQQSLSERLTIAVISTGTAAQNARSTSTGLDRDVFLEFGCGRRRVVHQGRATARSAGSSASRSPRSWRRPLAAVWRRGATRHRCLGDGSRCMFVAGEVRRFRPPPAAFQQDARDVICLAPLALEDRQRP